MQQEVLISYYTNECLISECNQEYIETFLGLCLPIHKPMVVQTNQNISAACFTVCGVDLDSLFHFASSVIWKTSITAKVE